MNNSFFVVRAGRCEKSSSGFNIVLDKKRRFDSSLIVDVKKCRFNHVQVIICKPFSKSLRPFPATFWLMCPYLIKLAGTIESQNGVNELENFLTLHELHHQWRKYNFEHQKIRMKLMNKNLAKFMRKYHERIFKNLIRGGVGGIRYDTEKINVKCLHLQTASFIALGRHPAGEWLKSKGLCGDCGRALCSLKGLTSK